MTWLNNLFANLAASTARDERQADRAASRAAAYTGPMRRRTDAIDVEARVVEDPLALPAPEVAPP